MLVLICKCQTNPPLDNVKAQPRTFKQVINEKESGQMEVVLRSRIIVRHSQCIKKVISTTVLGLEVQQMRLWVLVMSVSSILIYRDAVAQRDAAGEHRIPEPVVQPGRAIPRIGSRSSESRPSARLHMHRSFRGLVGAKLDANGCFLLLQ